jgi:cytochrome c2
MVTKSQMIRLIELLTALAVSSVTLFVVLVLFSFQIESEERSGSETLTKNQLTEKKHVPMILHKKGEALFKDNCASCHSIEKDKVGPALKGVASRRDIVWIRSFVRNSELVIKSGDKTAEALFQKYKADMTKFPSFTNAEIDSIVAYIGEAGK